MWYFEAPVLLQGELRLPGRSQPPDGTTIRFVSRRPFAVRGYDDDTGRCLIYITRAPRPVPGGWVELSPSQASAWFERVNGRAPVGAEVPAAQCDEVIQRPKHWTRNPPATRPTRGSDALVAGLMSPEVDLVVTGREDGEKKRRRR